MPQLTKQTQKQRKAARQAVLQAIGQLALDAYNGKLEATCKEADCLPSDLSMEINRLGWALVKAYGEDMPTSPEGWSLFGDPKGYFLP